MQLERRIKRERKRYKERHIKRERRKNGTKGVGEG
jgi:hypothetical protein